MLILNFGSTETPPKKKKNVITSVVKLELSISKKLPFN